MWELFFEVLMFFLVVFPIMILSASSLRKLIIGILLIIFWYLLFH